MTLVRADPNTEGVRELIQRLQPKVAGEATEMDLMYWPGFMAKFPDLQYLSDNANQYKTVAVDLVMEGAREKVTDELMPYTNQSTLVIGAMYGLQPNEYLDFSDQVLSRAETEKLFLTYAQLSALIFPRHELTGLFSMNYQHPRVREILEKAKRLWVEQLPLGKIQEFDFTKAIDMILSGETAQGLDRRKKRNPDEYPNNLQTSILPAVNPKLNESMMDETTLPRTAVTSSMQSDSSSPSKSAASALARVDERRVSVWPWVAGIIAVALIYIFALKRWGV